MLKLITIFIVLVGVMFLLIPGIKSLAKGKSDFEIQGSILKAYTGNDDTITIPDRVTEIGPGAFKESKLTNITIPYTVNKIHSQAFYGCNNLTRVIISEGVETIGMSAFASCHKLNFVSIPSTVTSIEPGVFADCPNLSSIQLSPLNSSFFFNDGVLFDRESKELIQYLAGTKTAKYQIPFTVKKIDRFAFWGAANLKEVSIVNGIKEIPEHAFSNCIGLNKIELPSKLERIGSYAFSDCSNLSLVVFNSKPVIEKTAFDRCSKKLIKTLAEENPIFREMAAQEEEAENKNKVSSLDGNTAVSSLDGKEKVSPNNGTKAKKSKPEADKWKDGAIHGKVKKKNGSYSKIFYPEEISNEPIDQGEDVVGASKISGGTVFVIPKKDK